MRRWIWIGLGLWLACASLPFPALAEEWTKTFPISGHPELRIESSDAGIHIDAWEQKSIAVKVTSEKWGFGQGALEVYDHQVGDSVEIEVRLPRGMPILSLGNRCTRVEIHMPHEGKLRVHTGDGEIRVRDAKGELDLESGDGHLEVEGVDGILRAHSGDGQIRARGRFDALDVSTSDGRIEAEALPGSSVGKGWNLKTGDGSVTLTVPETLAADVVLHTGYGHITLDMPLTIEGRYDSSNVRGKLNGGGGVLLIHSGDGSIRLGRS